jgi:hypothetical protein
MSTSTQPDSRKRHVVAVLEEMSLLDLATLVGDGRLEDVKGQRLDLDWRWCRKAVAEGRAAWTPVPGRRSRWGERGELLP